MCDHDTLDHESQRRREIVLSRRDFNLLALSAALVAALPGEAKSTALKQSMVNVKTPDGIADCYFTHPRKGKHPAVLLWPDFMSLRPAYKQMADKLAQSGYAVLVINMYYRGAKSPLIEKADFENKSVMDKIRGLAGALNDELTQRDALACVQFLDAQTAVDSKRKIGTQGYCMGGGFAFDTAAANPERIGAVACFHGNLVNKDKPEAAHALIAKIKAEALVAIATNDDERNPTEKTVLREAFAKSGVKAEIEVYEGTQHGWCTPDMVSYYNEAQAKRAWERLLALYERAL